MSRRALILALSISLLFNLGFLVGWMHPHPPAAHEAHMHDEPLHDLHLTRDQRRRVLRSLGDERQASLVDELRARERLRLALAEEPVDGERVRAAAEALATVQSARCAHAHRVVADAAGMLDDGQRRELATRLAAEDYRGPRWRALRARFDVNHDGRLDEHERAAAMATSPTK